MSVPHPYPAGWYRFRYSHELSAGQVIAGRFFGKPLVGFRTEGGAAHVFDAHCRHMGAHLGDGRIVGDTLQCPFHGWRYAGSGECVHVPFSKQIPRGARVNSYPVLERNGTIYFWHDTTGEAPWFDVPSVHETTSPEWKRAFVHRQHIRCRVQEPRENAIDVSHGPVLHAKSFPPYPGCKGEIRNWREDPGTRRLSFDLVNTFVRRGRPLETTLQFSLAGPGHLELRSRLPIETLYLVPNTPVDEEHLVFTMLSYVKRSRVPFVDSVLARMSMRHLVRGLLEDYVIFAKKRYLTEPLLTSADGPILEMRRWLRQFDPAARAATAGAGFEPPAQVEGRADGRSTRPESCPDPTSPDPSGVGGEATR